MISYLIPLLESWLPMFSNYLIYIFAFVVLCGIFKIFNYFITI